MKTKESETKEVPLNNPGNIETLQGLARPGLKLVLTAADVPVGKYLRQSLEKMNASFGANFSDRVLANTVSNEDNAKQVAAKFQLGEADAGIVYVTDAQGAVQRIEIPAEFNIVAHYPIPALKASQESALAQDFVVFVLSTKARPSSRNGGLEIKPLQKHKRHQVHKG